MSLPARALPEPEDQDGVEVIAVPHPFSTKRIRILVGELATLEEIVSQAGLPPGCHARVFIERAGLTYGPIGREWWPRIRPKRGSRVTIRAVPYGGGGGGGDSNKTTRLILQIVVLIAAIVLTIVSEGALSWTIPIAVGTIVANVAINMLLPIQPPKLGSLAALSGAGGRPAESPTFSITGSQNKANPYGPIPKVYGRARLFPPCTEGP